jgi:lipoprotein-releasing system permease protein
MMSFELFVALRYLLAKRKQAFISLISLISIVGVGVGVTALLIALALMTGLQAELRDRIIGSAAHVYVFKVGGVQNPEQEMKQLLQLPRVQGAAPVVAGKGMIISGKGEAFIDVKGIDPEREKAVTQLQNSIRKGSAEALNRAADEVPGILIGTDLAETLQVDVGDQVQIMSPEGTITPLGPLFRPRTFQVVGIFNLGLFQFDSEYGFVRIDVAQRVLGPDQPMFIELRVDDMFKSQEVVDSIVERFGPEYMAHEWSDLNRSLFSALWLEKMAISITIGLIVMVAILKTMGSSAASIRRIFMLQGLIIGLVGTAAGAVAGCALIYVLDRFRLISVPVDVYQISYVPFTLELWPDFLVVVGSAILICFGATIYPSRQAAKLDPAQALRYQ